MAAALSGCVIVGQDGKIVKYKKKCNFCGWLDSTTSAWGATPGCKLNSAFYCFKCKKKSDVIIQG